MDPVVTWTELLRFLCGAAWILALVVAPAVNALRNGRDSKSRSI